jgi:hypothetical protein
VPFEVGEGSALVIGRGVVNLSEDPGEELPPHLDHAIEPDSGIAVAALGDERDGLGHDVPL